MPVINLNQRNTHAWNGRNATARVYTDTYVTSDLDVNYTITGTGASNIVNTTGIVTILNGTFSVDIEIIKNSNIVSGIQELTLTITAPNGYTSVIDSRVFFVSENEPLPAFPNAYGAGAYSQGGRGGTVLHVTNLDWNDNQGSLKWALKEQYPRTIVFDVSGTIKVTDSFFSISGSNYDNLTIAGQTAPEGGITLEAVSFGLLNLHNLIIRYIRFVDVSYFENTPVSGIGLSLGGSFNAVVDHVTARYTWNSLGITAQENNNQNNNQGNITIQNSLIAECLTGSIMGAIVNDSANDEYRVINCGANTFHHNMFVDVDHRFPNIAGNSAADVYNNLTYNYRSRLNAHFNHSETNLINNTWKSGGQTPLTSANRLGTYTGFYKIPRVYTSGNYVISSQGNHLPTDSSWDSFMLNWDNSSTGGIVADEAKYRQFTPFDALGRTYSYDDAEGLLTLIPNKVGANAYLKADGSVGYYLDIVDAAQVSKVVNNEQNTYIDKTDLNDLVYPVLPTNTRPSSYDTNNDGIPDVWTAANMPEGATYNDIAPSGYTWLEEFLNQVDGVQPTPPDPPTPVEDSYGIDFNLFLSI